MTCDGAVARRAPRRRRPAPGSCSSRRDVVFDGEKGEPYTEADEPAPLTDYGRAKADAERGVLAACPAALVVRTSLIYGGERPGPQERLAADPDATFFTDEVRCPIQVGDLADALIELAATERSGVLHVAGADRVSRAEFAQLLAGRPVRTATSRIGPGPAARLLARDRAAPAGCCARGCAGRAKCSKAATPPRIGAMDDWVLWMIAAGVLAVGEMFTLGFFLGPIAIAAVLAAIVALAGGGDRPPVDRLHRRRRRRRCSCCGRSRGATCACRRSCAPARPRWSAPARS